MSTPTRRATTNAARPRVDATNWHQHKACGYDDFDLFMSDDQADQEDAKEICAVCPAREFCLRFALEEKISFGVFGETTPEERKALAGPAESHDQITDLIGLIAGYRRQGLSWAQTESALDIPQGTLWKRVDRWAKAELKAGRDVPAELVTRTQRGLSQEQVLDIRRRACAGESDTAQALRMGMAKGTIQRIATGESYTSFGGPLRAKRSGHASKPNLASCTQFNRGQVSWRREMKGVAA